MNFLMCGKKYNIPISYLLDCGLSEEDFENQFVYNSKEGPIRVFLEALKKPNFINVFGNFGVGKTTLSKKAVIYFLKRKERARFLTGNKFLNEIYEYTKKGFLSEYLNVLGNISLLVIDDFDKILTDNDFVSRVILDVIDRRYGRKITIITSNKSFGDLKNSSKSDYFGAIFDRITVEVPLGNESYRRKNV